MRTKGPILTPILPALAFVGVRRPVEPSPVWHNDIDVGDVDRCLDRGERLSDIARDYRMRVCDFVAAMAGAPGAIGLSETRRRLGAGESVTTVAVRARVSSTHALYRMLADATSREVTRPAEKEALRARLGEKARDLMADPAKRQVLEHRDVSAIRAGEWMRFSPIRLLQVLEKLGAQVEVQVTVTINGAPEAIVLPLVGRLPI